ncbi:MAG: metalloregulator ArsR/SmtB family transcription factor [Anaerolineae bacterium]|nr:metalloregulator ArsR/SmtB family transcription factor [Anaerolineae bacterium]
MNMQLREEINQLHAHVCSGLADPNRILILYTLAESPSNVSDLAVNLAIPQPTVSRHLKVLRERSLVEAKRDGQSVIYRISDRRIIEALDLIRAMMADNLSNQVALAQQLPRG